MDPLELMQILQAGQGSQASPEDILTFQQNVAARNPWRIAAAPILGAKFDNRTWSPGASFATAAGQAFLGTALNGMAANREQEQMQLLAGALPSLYANPLQAQAPEGLDSGAFDSLRAPVLARQMSSRSKQLEELSKDLWSTKLQEVAAKGKRRGELEAEKEFLPTSLPTQPTEEISMGPDLGIKSLNQIESEVYRQKRSEGVPPTQASVSAREQVDGLRKRGKDMFNSKLTAANESIAQMEDIIRKGEEGMLKAGNTGSTLASLYEKTVATLSPILPGSQDEAIQQAEGDKALELTQNLGAMINRIAGSGALSDFESKALFATALSPSNTKQQNELILKNYRNGLEVAKEHASFMNYVADATQGNPEKANQLWELYKDQNPILTRNEKGEFAINRDRTPWQQFDFKNAYSAFLKGEKLGTEKTSAAIPAEIAQQFSGQKILSIKRVR